MRILSKNFNLEEKLKDLRGVIPSDWDHSVAEGGKSSKGTFGQIDGVLVDTAWAGITNDNINGVTIVGVGDSDTPAAFRRNLASPAISINVDGSDHVRVRGPLSASTSVSILVVEGGKSTSLEVNVAGVDVASVASVGISVGVSVGVSVGRWGVVVSRVSVLVLALLAPGEVGLVIVILVVVLILVVVSRRWGRNALLRGGWCRA